MSIQTEYSEILKRVQRIDNRDKYGHLLNSTNKTDDEQKLYNMMFRLEDNISAIAQCKNYADKTLIESECRILIPQIKEMLDVLLWS